MSISFDRVVGRMALAISIAKDYKGGCASGPEIARRYGIGPHLSSQIAAALRQVADKGAMKATVARKPRKPAQAKDKGLAVEMTTPAIKSDLPGWLPQNLTGRL